MPFCGKWTIQSVFQLPDKYIIYPVNSFPFLSLGYFTLIDKTKLFKHGPFCEQSGMETLSSIWWLSLFCIGDRLVFRGQVQGHCIYPWDLVFVCLCFKVFLYKDNLGFALPSIPTKIPLEPGITWQMLYRSIFNALKLEQVILKLRLHNLIWATISV